MTTALKLALEMRFARIGVEGDSLFNMWEGIGPFDAKTWSRNTKGLFVMRKMTFHKTFSPFSYVCFVENEKSIVSYFSSQRKITFV